MRAALSVLTMAAAAILGLTQCTALARNDGPAAQATAAQARGYPAPDLKIALYSGKESLGAREVTLSELARDGRPVVLNFWGGACPPCRQEMPHLQELHSRHGERVLVLGVDAGGFLGLGSREDSLALIDQLGITYPTGAVAGPEVLRAYNVVGLPTTYFITPRGEVIRRSLGLLSRERLGALVDQLLEASGQPTP